MWSLKYLLICGFVAGYGSDDEYCYGHGTDSSGGLNRYGQNGDRDGTGKGLLMDGDGDDHWRKSGGHSRGTGGQGDGWGFQGGSGDRKGGRDGDGRLGRNQGGKVSKFTLKI